MSRTRIGMFDYVGQAPAEARARWEGQAQFEAEHDAEAPRSRRRAKSRGQGVLAHLLRLACAALLITAGWLAWDSGWLPAQLRPAVVTVRGADMSSAQEVLGLLDCTAQTSLPQLWLRCRSADLEGRRWLSGVSMQLRPGREAVLQVSERRPLVRVQSGRLAAWLCDDGRLVPLDEKLDQGGRFELLKQLPVLTLPESYLGDLAEMENFREPVELAQAPALLSVVACCAEQLPLQVKSLELAEEGRMTLRLKDGFEVRLGNASGLAMKLAALPKALRLCEGHREKLLFLDASDSGIFYQKWKDVPLAQN
ncbi:cell division protein FtsQ [bacterium]|nr:cell division protein FtsQ [bacterium]